MLFRKLTLLLFLLPCTALPQQLVVPVANAGTTGTTLNSLASIVAGVDVHGNYISNAAITPTSPTNPSYIVTGGAGTSGQAQLVFSGQALCTMDSTIASGAAGYYVINSTSVAGDCHPQSAAPSSNTWVIGFVAASSTTSGSAALVTVNGHNTPNGWTYVVPSGSYINSWISPGATQQGYDVQGGSSNSIWIAAAFYVPPLTYSHIYLYIDTADATTSDLYSWATVNSSGTVNCSTTASDLTATGVVSSTIAACSQGSVKWPGGMMYLIITGEAATATFWATSGVSVIPFASAGSLGTTTGGQIPSTSVSMGTAGTSNTDTGIPVIILD
jgi:hypothetical protein